MSFGCRLIFSMTVSSLSAGIIFSIIYITMTLWQWITAVKWQRGRRPPKQAGVNRSCLLTPANYLPFLVEMRGFEPLASSMRG